MQTTKIDLDPYDPARVNAVMIAARRMRNETMADLFKALVDGRLWARLTGGDSRLPKGAAPQA